MKAVTVLTCALALALPMPATNATAPLSQRVSAGRAYRVACAGDSCTVDVQATADDIVDAAAPMIAQSLAAMPETFTAHGVTGSRPTLGQALASFRSSVVADLEKVVGTGGITVLATQDIGLNFICGANLSVTYAKNTVDLFFYTQTYYTQLQGLEVISCTPTGVEVNTTLACATWAVVAGFPMWMTGFGFAVRPDGSFTELCVYSLTPSLLGPLPNTLSDVRFVFGSEGWLVIGPHRRTLDD